MSGEQMDKKDKQYFAIACLSVVAIMAAWGVWYFPPRFAAMTAEMQVAAMLGAWAWFHITLCWSILRNMAKELNK